MTKLERRVESLEADARRSDLTAAIAPLPYLTDDELDELERLLRAGPLDVRGERILQQGLERLDRGDAPVRPAP